MSGLSNFLGNVYGDDGDPDSGDPTAGLPLEDRPQEPSLDDVKASMNELLHSAAGNPEDPAPNESEQPDDGPDLAATSPAWDLQDWGTPSDKPMFAWGSEAEPTFDAAPEPEPEPEPATLDDFFSDTQQSPSGEGRWFDHLEDLDPEEEPAAVEEPDTAETFETLETFDPFRLPPPPSPLVTDEDLAPPRAETADLEDPEPWLDEIFAPVTEEGITPAADDPTADEITAASPADPGPAPQIPHSLFPIGDWESGYDDIIPGRSTPVVEMRDHSADDAVARAVKVAAERRRSRRGRRAVDDTANPIVTEQQASRRRRRRRTEDLTRLDQVPEGPALDVSPPTDRPLTAAEVMGLPPEHDEPVDLPPPTGPAVTGPGPAATPIAPPALTPVNLPPPADPVLRPIAPPPGLGGSHGWTPPPPPTPPERRRRMFRIER